MSATQTEAVTQLNRVIETLSAERLTLRSRIGKLTRDIASLRAAAALTVSALLLAAVLYDCSNPAAASDAEALWWWRTNDGHDVYVHQDFYYPALAVVPKESGWRAGVVSAGWYWDARRGWLPYYHCGWFQIEMHTHAGRFYQRGWSWEDCADPGKNSEIAHEIWGEQGWRPWPNTARGYY